MRTPLSWHGGKPSAGTAPAVADHNYKQQPLELLDEDLLDPRTLGRIFLGTSVVPAGVFIEGRIRQRVVVDRHGIRERTTGYDSGAHLFSDDESGYVATVVSTVTPAGIRSAAQAAGSTEDLLLPAAFARGRRNCRRPPLVDDRLLELARRAVERSREQPRVADAEIIVSGLRREIIVLTSTGDVSHDVQTRLRFVVRVVGHTGADALDGAGAWDVTGLNDCGVPDSVVDRAVRRLIRPSDSPSAIQPDLAVVLAPGAGGMLLHEVVGHMLECDIVGESGGLLADQLGQVVTTTELMVVDDPTVVQGWGSYRFDDEGAPARKTTLIDRGTLVGMLSAGGYPPPPGLPSSANGRRENYAHRAQPRMSNAYVAPGRTSAASIVEGVTAGMYCEALEGGQIDPVSGRFSLVVSGARRIERGELTDSVGAVNLTGTVLELLSGIEAVGDDFDVIEGVCGKGGQRVLTGMGSPTMLVTGLAVAT